MPDDARALGREGAVEDLAVLDPDEGFEALVGGVEVRRLLVVIHPDDDAEEERDDRHGASGSAEEPDPESERGDVAGKRGRLAA
jgi:hypothetical protein